MGGDRFDCSKCTEKQKLARGCEGGAKFRWQSEPDVYQDRCGEQYVKEEAQRFLLWKRTKTHGLPFAPLGWAEHPAYLMDIILRCDDEYDAAMARGKD